MNTWKANWDESKKRYVDWWNARGLIISMWGHLGKDGAPHAVVEAPDEAKDSEQFWFDPHWRSRQLHHKLSECSFLADIIPVADTFLAPGSLAACLGAGLEAGEDTVWIHQAPAYDGQMAFDEGNRWWQLHLDLLRECKKLSNGKYYVGCPDLTEGLDTLASIRGAEAVLMDMALDHDGLHQQLQRVNDVYLEVFGRLYEIIREGNEMAWCNFSIWGPGTVAKLQCDLSAMISEDDFRRFAQPYLREQARKIDYTLYHLDGVDAMRHVDALLEIDELNAIQWTPGANEPQGGNPRWYDLYRRILSGGKSVMPCWVELDELEPLLDNVGADGLGILMHFRSEHDIEAAQRIAEQYR
jgi:hypothetical protein